MGHNARQSASINLRDTYSQNTHLMAGFENGSGTANSAEKDHLVAIFKKLPCDRLLILISFYTLRRQHFNEIQTHAYPLKKGRSLPASYCSD